MCDVTFLPWLLVSVTCASFNETCAENSAFSGSCLVEVKNCPKSNLFTFNINTQLKFFFTCFILFSMWIQNTGCKLHPKCLKKSLFLTFWLVETCRNPEPNWLQSLCGTWLRPCPVKGLGRIVLVQRRDRLLCSDLIQQAAPRRRHVHIILSNKNSL